MLQWAKGLNGNGLQSAGLDWLAKLVCNGCGCTAGGGMYSKWSSLLPSTNSLLGPEELVKDLQPGYELCKRQCYA